MKKLAFVTYKNQPQLHPDDHLAVAALQKQGLEVTPALWDDPAINWQGFDAVILCSCWDYHERIGEFRDWLAQLENIKLWNPLPLVRWNMDKGYLRDLVLWGVPVVETRWLQQGEQADLAALLVETGWQDAVIKPTIAAGAYHTWRTTPAQAAEHQAHLDEVLGFSGVMIQRYMPQIADEGEWSLLFFNKQYSHAVLKKPQSGDFRVQEMYGGQTEGITAPAELIAQAQKVVEAVPHKWLYARVDGVRENGQLVLMELEMVEPYLYMGHAPGSEERFAEAVARLV